MHAGLTLLSNQRGSALLIGIMMVFIMTILGLALFDLGLVEDRLRMVSQTDAAVFEITQAALQRAIFSGSGNALMNTMLTSETWNTVVTFPGTYADVAFTNTSFSGGTYAIAMREVTLVEANGTLGLSCI